MSHDVISKKLDEVLKGVHDAQSAAKHAEGRIDAMKSEEIKKLAEDSAKAAEQLQEMKSKQEAGEKAALELEKKFCRVGAPGIEKGNEAYLNQMTRYLRKGESIDREVIGQIADELVEKSLYGLDESERAHEIKTLTAGVNPRGGYWIMPQRASQMVDRIFETSPIRQLATVMTTSSDVVEMIVDDNEAASGGWVGEVQSRGQTNTPDIGMLSIPVHEHFAQPKATQKMLDDAGFNIEAWLSQKVTDKLSREENTAFVVGDGSKKPKGFLTLPAWAAAGVYERDAIEQVNSGTLGTVTADGIINLQNSVKEFYQPNASWLMKRSTWSKVMLLKASTGEYLLSPTSLRDGNDLMLRGKRVIFADDMPEIANDSLSVVYGDFRPAYTIVDRFGFRVIRDDITEKGNVLFYTTKRVGGAVTNYESLKILKLSA